MPRPAAIYRFGPYELRVRNREIYKYGIRVKLRPQPLQVLQALLEKPGDVVTREELRQRLWHGKIFVEFEHGLNTAMKELRGLLNDSADHPRYIETLPKLGYRIIVPVGTRLEATEEDLPSPDLPAHVAPQGNRGSWLIPLAGSIVLIAAIALYFQLSRSHSRSQTSAARAMLAVLPFENLTGDAGQDYFSDGLTEEMIGQLGRIDPQHLGIIARTSVMHYKHSQEPLQQIGRELGVQYVLEGSVRHDSGKVRISAQLIQMKDQTHLWSRQYDRELSSLLALQGEVAQEIADNVVLTLGDGRKLPAGPRKSTGSPTSYEAFDLYLRGRYFWNKRTVEGFRQAADDFQQAIAKDPQYARAYAGLADTFGLISTWEMGPQSELMPKARAAAVRALELDESLAEAHTSLALITESYDYDWPTAEKEFRRAIQLDPSYATAHQWYAEFLSWQGRFDEALAESEQARLLDPMSLIIATDHGAILYYARQYDRAIAQWRAVLEMDPDFSRARMIAFAYVEEDKLAEAMNEAEHLHPDASPWTYAIRAYVYGRCGRMTQAQQSFAKMQESIRHENWDPPWIFVLAYLGLNEKDKAITLLQEAYSEHSPEIVFLKVEPALDPLRSDPRFQDLLRRVGLAQ
jgi:TolB-like protein/DNA-binding winged helix-turn-helix (wHTH) protein/Tfp pilus assembly protein PilF